jgi:restriction system protein
MAIPDFQRIMLPALKFVAEKGTAKSSEVFPPIIKHFKLSDDETTAMLPSGKQRVIDNRTQWALFYLFKAGLLQKPKRGFYVITDAGKGLLKKGVDAINIELLNEYDSFRQFRALRKEDKNDSQHDDQTESVENPEESLEKNYEVYKSTVVSDLISKVRAIDPGSFEELIIELLKAMGYGVGEKNVLHLGKSGDGGVDGEINQDILGLDKIYIQAKRYDAGNQVGRPAIQQFVGSLNERKSKKGIFITSSAFSGEAKEYVKKIDMVIRLIDGRELAELMYSYDIGVEKRQTYFVKVINDDYFEDL